MIYLKVRGGLCNRVRTLDSFFTLCKKYNKDFVVLWPMDKALNADFDSLFRRPSFKEFHYEVIPCPPGYPEIYLPSLENRVKNLLKGRKIDGKLRSIAKEIHKTSEDRFLSESYLDNVYNEIIYETQGKVGDMDNLFCERLRPKVEALLETDSSMYINSCYRLHEIEDDYANFVPQDDIQDKINQTISKFDQTFGLHIRRSDHKASKEHSTLEKFTRVVETEIEADSNATFFISTDDEPTKTELCNKYGDKIIFNEISSFDRNSPEAVKEAVLDLYCLANTKKLYGSHHSSFSQVAAIIGGIEEVTVK